MPLPVVLPLAGLDPVPRKHRPPSAVVVSVVPYESAAKRANVMLPQGLTCQPARSTRACHARRSCRAPQGAHRMSAQSPLRWKEAQAAISQRAPP